MNVAEFLLLIEKTNSLRVWQANERFQYVRGRRAEKWKPNVSPPPFVVILTVLLNYTISSLAHANKTKTSAYRAHYHHVAICAKALAGTRKVVHGAATPPIMTNGHNADADECGIQGGDLCKSTKRRSRLSPRNNFRSQTTKKRIPYLKQNSQPAGPIDYTFPSISLNNRKHQTVRQIPHT